MISVGFSSQSLRGRAHVNNQPVAELQRVRKLGLNPCVAGLMLITDEASGVDDAVFEASQSLRGRAHVNNRTHYNPLIPERQ